MHWHMYFYSIQDGVAVLLQVTQQLTTITCTAKELTQVNNVVKKTMEEVGSSGSGKQRFQYRILCEGVGTDREIRCREWTYKG